MVQVSVDIPEDEISGSPRRCSTKHVAVAINLTEQRTFLAAIDNVHSASCERLGVLPVHKVIAKNGDVLLLNVRYNTT